MGKWVHRLSEIDEVNRTAVCANCGPVAIRKRSSNRGWRCSPGNPNTKQLHYRAPPGSVCERCDFVPEHICQIDVHHRDGNKENNDPSNHSILCANCHRLTVLGLV